MWRHWSKVKSENKRGFKWREEGGLISSQVQGMEATQRREGPGRGPGAPRLQTLDPHHNRGVN